MYRFYLANSEIYRFGEDLVLGGPFKAFRASEAHLDARDDQQCTIYLGTVRSGER
jgi:hypothetical protein